MPYEDWVREGRVRGRDRRRRVQASAAGFGMRRVHRLRFRRAALAQVDGQPYHRADRQELTLPVLQGLEPEPARGGVVDQRHLSLAVQPLLGVVLGQSAEEM